eukprot:jgi/Chrpa1/3737/Chrysochromulina_OHIO_Genome00003109-RA
MWMLLSQLLVPISAMRVLCLHGKGGSAASFLDDLQPLRSALPAIEFQTMDAPGGTRSWWTYPRGERSFSASSFSGDDVSIAAVEAELVKGGYDGILGFSQGAMLAAVVAARSALGQGPPDSKLSLTVCCGAALPKPFEPLFAALRESGGAPAIRSLHCLSAVDTMNPPELGKALATSFGTSASLLWHDNGHTLPPSESLDRGGEFLLADGREVLSALSPSLLQQLHDRRLRVRVAALPTEWLAHGGPMPPTVRTLLASVIERVIGAALAVGVPLGLELAWSSDGKLLQILEPTKSAFNRHPVSREPTFFSGVHSQSRYLQQARAADMFGGVGVTDVLDGDLAPLEIELLDEIESVMTRLTRRVLMQPGDVVLLDSYQTLHGRETFEGPRRHGVLWLTSR